MLTETYGILSRRCTTESDFILPSVINLQSSQAGKIE